ncbi:MAG: tetratricopeptide repeat protein, partial [Candidatus Rokubacteria bacterium]|nr:tetratricopeptide repeat protein [Candidatus Rokubacteria bacterium]
RGWGAGAWRQSQIWQSSERLWQAALEADPECALCNNNMGAAIVRSGRADPARLHQAEAHFRYAILLRPERPDPYHNLGALLAGQKRYHEAGWALRTYMRLSPGAPDGPLRLGMLYVDQGRYAEAVASLDGALRL